MRHLRFYLNIDSSYIDRIIFAENSDGVEYFNWKKDKEINTANSQVCNT
jgi:hypothetical protein